MKREREQSLPEARKEGLVVQHLSDEVLVYDQQRHKAHCLNETAALVWMRCDGKTTVASMAQELSKQTGTRVGEDIVWLALNQLGKSRLLQGAATKNDGVSRREMMKRAGLAAAIALPVVTSIVAPTATQAATCKASGQPCTASAQCCSGVCNTPSNVCA
ncbi:MAG: PqqD family peptide modification chaperone [Blastocatellia bacterium]